MTHVLLWSKKLNCFNVKSIEAWLHDGRSAYLNNSNAIDWVPLFFGREEVVSETAKLSLKTLQKRVGVSA